MGMFYDVFFERKEDAVQFLDCLPWANPNAPKSVEENGLLLNDPDCPVIIWNLKPGDRSKAITQEQVSHPVNYSFNAAVRDSLFLEAGDFLVDMLCTAGPRFTGSVSLVCYGERVFFRMTPISLEAYNFAGFWEGKRFESLRAAFGDRVSVRD
jgi:hypothetical protein